MAAGADRDGMAGDELVARPILVGDRDPALASQATMPAHEVDPVLLEPCRLARIIPVGGEGVASRQDGRYVECPRGGGARTGDRPRVRQGLQRPQERLARNARPVGAFASDALGVGVGWPCLDQGWSVVDEKRYAELAPAVEKLVEKPFEPRRMARRRSTSR